jgi:putative spermidine/putrescine transport system substrate-binding protein
MKIHTRAVSRRLAMLQAASALALVATGGRAWAREALTAVEWGGTWLDSSKALLAGQNDFDVNWVLHAGASSAILPKIKSSLPRVPYDLVHSFPPVTAAMIKEGWLEPLTFDDVPNLRDVPDGFLTRDGQGHVINCPTSSIGAFWGYRPDVSGMPIRTAQDLLDPRLKGKVLALSPSLQSGRFLLSLALNRGGNERNIGPGFEFAKDLARSGNIGRVAQSDIDVVNSITSGETAVAFTSLPAWSKITQSQKVEYLVNKPEDDKTFKTFISQEEWTLLKGALNGAAAKHFMNWFISPAVHEKYCALMGILPINRKSKAPASVAFLVHTSEADRKRYEYYPDYPYIVGQLKAWNDRWDAEVMPLMR